MTLKCGYLIAVIRAATFLSLVIPAQLVPAETDTRLPVPSQEDVAKAQGLIRAAYQSELQAAMEAREPAPLLGQLRSAADAADDPVRKYALLLEAREIASQFDDAEATLAFVDRLSEVFKIDALLERSQVQEKLAGPRIVPDLPLLKEAQITATKAAADQRYDIAHKSATLAVSIAQAIDRAQKAAVRPGQRKPAVHLVVSDIDGPNLIRATRDLQARLQRERTLHEAYQEARLVLDTRPDDAAANAAVATYLCFVGQKWEHGLRRLAESDLPVLAELAREEVRFRDADATDPIALYELAGKWWDASKAGSELTSARNALQRHAAILYSESVGSLNDPLLIRLAATRIRQGLTLPAPSGADRRRVIPLVVKGQLVAEASRKNGWTEADGFCDGIGQIIGYGKDIKGDSCTLRFNTELVEGDYTIKLVLSVEKVGRTNQSTQFGMDDSSVCFGWDGSALGDRNIFWGAKGDYRPAQGPRVKVEQGKKYLMNLQRNNNLITWSVDDQVLGIAPVKELDLMYLELTPFRGHIRVYDAEIALASSPVID